MKINIFIFCLIVLNNLTFISLFSADTEYLEYNQSLMDANKSSNDWETSLLEVTNSQSADEAAKFGDSQKLCPNTLCFNSKTYVPTRSLCLGLLTGSASLGIPMFLGSAAASVTSLCLSNWTSALKPIVPKSEKNKAKQLVKMAALVGCGAGLDITASFFGFPTNYAFSGLCGAAATTNLKRFIKAYTQDDLDEQKRRFRAEKKEDKKKDKNIEESDDE
jgi:hypothetical protein